MIRVYMGGPNMVAGRPQSGGRAFETLHEG